VLPNKESGAKIKADKGINTNCIQSFRILLLIFPKLPLPLKEWTYAGYAFDFIFAGISHFIVDGPGSAIFPLIILKISYINYFKNVLQ
jgi:hypothetical protein